MPGSPRTSVQIFCGRILEKESGCPCMDIRPWISSHAWIDWFRYPCITVSAGHATPDHISDQTPKPNQNRPKPPQDHPRTGRGLPKPFQDRPKTAPGSPQIPQPTVCKTPQGVLQDSTSAKRPRANCRTQDWCGIGPTNLARNWFKKFRPGQCASHVSLKGCRKTPRS